MNRRSLFVPRLTFVLAVAIACTNCGNKQPAPTTQPTLLETVAQNVTTLRAVTATATTTLNTLSDARDRGIITQADMNAAKPVIDALYAARNQAERDLRAGNTSAADSARKQLLAALGELAPLLEHIAAKH